MAAKRPLSWPKEVPAEAALKVDVEVVFQNRDPGQSCLRITSSRPFGKAAGSPDEIELLTFWNRRGEEWLLNGKQTLQGKQSPQGK
jgi:hypothetical protein